MTTTATSLNDVIASFRPDEADAGAAIFEWIEQAALVNVTACVDTVTEAIKQLPQDDAARIFCWKGLAHALCYDNQFHAAAEVLRDAAALASRLNRDGDQATLLLTMVQPLERLGRAEEAEEAARRALASFTARGDEFSAARAMVNLGVVRRVRGDSADALAWFDRARPAFASHSLAAGTLDTNAAEALLDLDRFDEAAAAFERARDLFEQGGHALGTAIAESNLADVFSRLGRIDEATLLFERARERFAVCDAPADAARLLAEEAEAFSVVGAYRRAIRLYEGALPALQTPGMTIELARAHLGHGLCLLRLGAGSRAVQSLLHAVELAQGEGTATLRQDAQLALAESYIAVGRLATAVEALELLLPQLAHRPAKQTHALLALASAALAENDSSLASRHLASAAIELERSPLIGLRLRHHELLARVLACNADAPGAWRELEHAIHIAERFRGSMRADFIRASFAESASDLYQFAIDIAMLSTAEHRATRVFSVVERSRARSLVEALAGRATHTACAADSMLTSQLNAMYATAGRQEHDATALRRIADLESQLERTTDRREATRLLSNVPAIQLAEAQQSLDKATVVSFYLHSGQLHAMVVSGHDVQVVSLALNKTDIASLSRRHALAIDLATRAAGPTANVASDALARAFMPLARHLVQTERVTLVPCRELHGFPIAAIMQMVLDDAGATACVSLSPSVTAGLAVRTSWLMSARRALVVGVADETAPRMEEEAAAVAACHQHATLLCASDATAETFLRELPQHEIVHIATHCVFDPEFPMASRLKLSDRWVAAREFYDRLRPGCVVVLAGCETGRTSDTIGEDRFGLIRAMLVGGASLVIASQWRLHDESASRAFPALHRLAVADGGVPAIAYAVALASIRRSQRQQGEPWYIWQSLFSKGALL